MNPQTEELISAAMDGEAVDVAALRDALGTAAGRDALASFVLLRAATAAGDDEPAHARRLPVSIPLPRKRRFALLAGPRIPASLAASIAVLAVVASFWFSARLQAPGGLAAPVVQMGAPPPPAPAPPAPGPPPAITDAAAPRAARPCTPEPPKPTRTLRFVSGVDWRSGT